MDWKVIPKVNVSYTTCTAGGEGEQVPARVTHRLPKLNPGVLLGLGAVCSLLLPRLVPVPVPGGCHSPETVGQVPSHQPVFKGAWCLGRQALGDCVVWTRLLSFVFVFSLGAERLYLFPALGACAV